MTIRSGCSQSWTAVPSRRNSGFDTTAVSGRPRAATTTLAEPTGTVDLVTTIGARFQVGGDLGGRLLDEAEIGGAVGPLGRGHAEEDEVSPAGRLGRFGREGQPPGCEPLLDQVGRSHLEDRGFTLPHHQPTLAASTSTAHDPVAEMGEAGGGGETDIAGADNGDGARAAQEGLASSRFVILRVGALSPPGRRRFGPKARGGPEAGGSR